MALQFQIFSVERHTSAEKNDLGRSCEGYINYALAGHVASNIRLIILLYAKLSLKSEKRVKAKPVRQYQSYDQIFSYSSHPLEGPPGFGGI